MTIKNKTSLVVFASGQGTNFKALCKAIENKQLPAHINALVTNVKGAGAVQVAKTFNVKTFEVPHANHTRASHESEILKALAPLKIDWIILAGYMRLFTPEFIQKFWDPKIKVSRIINIHPSLLPAFPGVNAYAQALQHGVKVTGVTIHFVSNGLDDGPIIAQEALLIKDDDTEESLKARGLKLEHKLYVETLRKLFTEGGFS